LGPWKLGSRLETWFLGPFGQQSPLANLSFIDLFAEGLLSFNKNDEKWGQLYFLILFFLIFYSS
jgi:hypothetical protein